MDDQEILPLKDAMEGTVSPLEVESRRDYVPPSNGHNRTLQFLLIATIGIAFLLSDYVDIKIGKKDSHVSKDTLPNSSPKEESPVETPVNSPVEESPVESPVSGPSSTEPSQYLYVPRGRAKASSELTAEQIQAMEDKWGKWELVDEKDRPQHDFAKDFPNRDIPHDQFPSNAWQIDEEYLAKFLPEALKLVTRAEEAILAEYGQPEEGEWGERSKMFKVFKSDDPQKANGKTQGGYTNDSSWEGLKRRLLHAIMTEDQFVFAMGGHSAAAGHGNHFQQSYTLQVQWILEAVFARLGVKHESRNFGNGGLGTLHNGLAAGSIYGPDVDVLMWDSGMTEKDKEARFLFARQGLLGGIKVPIMWTKDDVVANRLLGIGDIDAGFCGSGRDGVRKATTMEEYDALPWASQSLNCGGDIGGFCKSEHYKGNCWIERDDYTPQTKQDKIPGGRASWHPGNRFHQLQGRVIAFTFLEALREVLEMWNGADGYVVPDDSWHVSTHYDKIRKSVAGHPTPCKKYQDNGMEFLCNTAMKGRTLFTPRAYPPFTDIRSLMPPAMLENLEPGLENVYEGPDVFNPVLHPPIDAVDVLSIVEAGVPFQSTLYPKWAEEFYKKPSFQNPPKVPVGKGVQLEAAAGDPFCDGSVNSFCSRGPDQTCLLRAHNDGRHGLMYDCLSGWTVMNIPDLKHGYVVVKFESWHPASKVTKTQGWTTIDNEESRVLEGQGAMQNTTAGERELKKKNKGPGRYCPDFKFEYAIDGKVTTLNLEEYDGMKKQLQRVVEAMTLLNDPDYTGGKEQEVEVAVRISGCQKPAHKLTHIYWA